MAIFASLIARLGFDTSGWTAGSQKANKDLKALDSSSKKFFADLRSDFGRTSAIGQASRLFMATGALGGIAQAGHALAEFSGKVADMADKFHNGQISGGEMAKTIGESIPVLGGFFKTGENIVEMFTHWEAKQKALNEAYKQSDAIWNKEIERAHQLHENQEKFIDDLDRIAKEKGLQRELDGAANDQQRDLIKATQDRGKALDELQEKYRQYEKEQTQWNNDASARLRSAELSPASTEAQQIARKAMISSAQAEVNLRQKQEQEAGQKIADAKLSIESEYQAKRAKIEEEYYNKDIKDAREVAEKQAKEKAEVVKKAAEEALRDQESELEEDIRKAHELHSHRHESVRTENMRFGGVVQLPPNIINPMQKTADAQLDELKKIKKQLADISAGTGGEDVASNF